MHDCIVRFFVKNLQKKFRAKHISAANRNEPDGTLIPDFELTVNNEKIYYDVGISENMYKYYNEKKRKYENNMVPYKIEILMFQKNGCIHPDT